MHGWKKARDRRAYGVGGVDFSSLDTSPELWELNPQRWSRFISSLVSLPQATEVDMTHGVYCTNSTKK